MVLAGCGRVAFDPVAADACAAVGHDEDGDGLDDACDPCPHLAGDAADADRDGVGDACDPNTAPVDHFTLFEPFLVSRPDVWSYNGQTMLGADVLNISGVNLASGVELLRAAVPGGEVVSFDLDVTAGGSGSQRQFAYQIADGDRTYFCELNDQHAATSLNLTYTFDGATYTNVMIALASGSITSGHARITMQNAFPHIICTGEWNGQMLRAEGDVPASLTGTQHYFAANNVDVSLRSAVRIATGP